MKLMMVICVLSTTASTLAQSPASAGQPLNGEWQLTTTMLGIKNASRVMLSQSANQVQGSFYSDGEHIPLTGTVDGENIRFQFKVGNQQSNYEGRMSGEGMSGSFTMVGKAGTLAGNWTAQRAPQDKPSSLRNLEFSPTEFHRLLSADIPPVLRIWPGDTVHTTSVDAGGQDEKSAFRVAGGNPLTGPFYVEGAMPGDTVAITIKRLRLNRDWAVSDSGLVGRALTTDYASDNKQDWKSTRWHLDSEKMLGTLEDASPNLKGFSVKLRPMLGCVGVAPHSGAAPVSTQDSGYIGGNMDFSGVAEGSTVYLRVHQPGALVYLGDAHALQGDGELNGNALETSMDIEFTINVLREKYIGTPRVENSEYLMVIGLSGSLDDAFRKATSELASWLQSDYKLTPSEAATVLGTCIEYTISEVADRDVGVVAKIRKSSLASFPQPR